MGSAVTSRAFAAILMASLSSGCPTTQATCDGGASDAAACNQARAQRPSGIEFTVDVVTAEPRQLTQVEVSEKLFAAGLVLQEREGESDHACCVNFALGQYMTNAQVPLVIGNEVDMVDTQSIQAAFVVVKDINWCGEPEQPGMATLGCAAQGLFPAVVLGEALGLAWAHEFGHVQGLDARRCQNPDMDGVLGLMCHGVPEGFENRRLRVSRQECANNFSVRRNQQGVVSSAAAECR